ncbi:hypothetical protein F5Y12DRAFT_716299 [Xylaria sp. FL1777]|nr:hypothetical protein F5Y12DRAFT_716299 [Xylaria sp. FL1777]
MLCPVWGVISILCTAGVALTVVAGIYITITQVECVTEIVMLVVGMTRFDHGRQTANLSRESDSGLKYKAYPFYRIDFSRTDDLHDEAKVAPIRSLDPEILVNREYAIIPQLFPTDAFE